MATDATPDGLAIMGLCEIENKSVVQDIVNNKQLKSRNYQIVHIEGPDKRGVDPSFIYNPNYFKVKVGVPVRGEITSSGEPGCDSGSMIANGLLDGAVYLNPNAGQVTVKEFTPQSVGTYKFTCPMGMGRETPCGKLHNRQPK